MSEDRNKFNTGRLRLISAMMFMCFLAFLSIIYYSQYYQLSKELNVVNEEAGKIESINKELEKEVTRLQEDEYIEFLARRHLGLSRSENNYSETEE